MKPIPKYIALLIVVILFYACASTGWSPDGGPYDETPPKFVRVIIPARMFLLSLMSTSI